MYSALAASDGGRTLRHYALDLLDLRSQLLFLPALLIDLTSDIVELLT